MDILCVGMYRAGSTWQYLVTSDLVERHLGGRRLGFLDGEQFAAHEASCATDAVPHVLKSHDAHPRFAAALAQGRALAVYSYRDLRDVAFSLAHKYVTSFEEVVERHGFLHVSLANDAFWTAQPRTLCQSYEQLVTAPEAAVAALAAHLGIALAAGEAAMLAERYSLAANRSRTVELSDRLRAQGLELEDPANALARDEHTQLHWNHIRAGRIGAWREQATPRQIAVLAAICGPWLIARGYEPDSGWIAPALDLLREELAATRLALSRTETELARLRPLGPAALRVAWRCHELAQRHPRLWAALRRLLTRLRDTRPGGSPALPARPVPAPPRPAADYSSSRVNAKSPTSG